MMRLFTQILLLVFTGVFFTTCKKENMCDCVKGTGANITVTRQLEAFNKIIAQDKVDVHIINGNEFSVKVEAGKQVIKLIKTKVENNTLTITDDNRCDFTRSYKRKVIVYVTLPVLKHLTQDGVGDIYMDTQFVCDTFRYAVSNSGNTSLDIKADIVFGGMHGNGDVTMKGVVKENYIHSIGEGFFDSYDTDTQSMIVTLRSSGKIKIRASNYIKLDLYNRSTGNVYYKGNPAIIEKIGTGKGELINDN
jgi:Putative auto-transporter adhesin, head GIN domain